MKRLVDQMLDLQKMDAGKLQLHKTPEDLVYFVKSCIEPFNLLANRLNIELNFKDLSPSSSTNKMVSIDSLQMEKVIGNLLSNAFKFSPANSTIDIIIQPVDSKILNITIKDEGPGFEPAAEKRLFNRFSQELSTGQRIATQGTGNSNGFNINGPVQIIPMLSQYGMLLMLLLILALAYRHREIFNKSSEKTLPQINILSVLNM